MIGRRVEAEAEAERVSPPSEVLLQKPSKRGRRHSHVAYGRGAGHTMRAGALALLVNTLESEEGVRNGRR